MTNPRSLSIITGIILALFFTSQVLAQAPIDGWDKAKFGMTPQELKDAYKEEEQHHNNLYQQKIVYLEKHYTNNPEQLEQQKEWMEKNEKEFWAELDKDPDIGRPHKLMTLHLQPIPPLKTGDLFSGVFFSFGDSGLFEIEIMVSISEVMYIYKKEILQENKPEQLVAKAEKASEEFDHKLYELFYALSTNYGASKMDNGVGSVWTWKDMDGGVISLNVDRFKFSQDEREYSLLSSLTMTFSGIRTAATYAVLRKYVHEPCELENLLSEAWKKFTIELWGTSHPTTAREAAEARVSGKEVPPVPVKYNNWVKRIKTADYDRVPDFDKPLAVFLTIGGRTLDSFGSPSEVESMMNIPALKRNNLLVIILGLPEELKDWNAASIKNKSFRAKFAAYVELTNAITMSEKLRDFLFKEWFSDDLVVD